MAVFTLLIIFTLEIKTEYVVMNVGVGQTGPTCWFNSSLNMFLTSDNGLKILWQKL